MAGWRLVTKPGNRGKQGPPVAATATHPDDQSRIWALGSAVRDGFFGHQAITFLANAVVNAPPTRATAY